MVTEITPEFSRIISLLDIETEVIEVNIQANSLECEALAKRFSVKSIQGLSAKLIFSKIKEEYLPKMEAGYTAEITQACVLTLEPITSIIQRKFFSTFAEKDSLNIDEELVFSVKDADPPELSNNGLFDVGELVSEYLSLEIDPFPRSVNAEFPQSNAFSDIKMQNKLNPFKTLEKLKSKEK